MVDHRSCEITFFIFYGYITNSQYDQLSDGLIEYCTGIAEVMGSSSGLNVFFQVLISQLLKLCV